jgi:hypothetical protein
METVPNFPTRKAVMIGLFFAGFFAAVLWLLERLSGWVHAVLKATGH